MRKDEGKEEGERSGERGGGKRGKQKATAGPWLFRLRHGAAMAFVVRYGAAQAAALSCFGGRAISSFTLNW